MISPTNVVCILVCVKNRMTSPKQNARFILIRGIIQECFKVQDSFAEIQIDSTHLSVSGKKICHVLDRPRVSYLFGREKRQGDAIDWERFFWPAIWIMNKIPPSVFN